MRGEELHGLNIVELQELEKSLEVGLSRVLEKKVSSTVQFYLFFCCFRKYIKYFIYI